MVTLAAREADADMTITKETKLKELLAEYPWLRGEVAKINDKFKMLNTPMGKIMLGKADISEMSKKSGMDADQIISKLNELIKSHS